MFAEYMKLLKLTLNAHRRFFIFWVAFQIILYTTYRASQFFSDPLTLGRAKVSINMYLVGAAFAATYFVFISYLGIFFHTWRKKSWLRQLPFSGLTLSLPPSSLILIVGASFYILHVDFWSGFAQEIGASVVEFVFLVPLIFYYSIRSFRSSFVGACVGLVINMLLMFIHLTLLWEWKTAHFGFQAELFYTAVLGLICILLERESRMHVLYLTLVIFTFTLIPLAYPVIRQASSLERAVLELNYQPTPASIANYKRFVTTRALWKAQPSVYASQKRAIKLLSQEQAEKYLSDEERKKFLALIIEFQENFARPHQTQSKFSYVDPFPMKRNQVTGAAKDYLIANWRDEEVFCYFVPRRVEAEILEKIFSSSQCLEAVSDLIWDLPFPNPDHKKQELLDQYFMAAHEKSPNELSVQIGNLFRNASDFPDEVIEWFGTQNWFRTRSINEKALTYIKEYVFSKKKARIRNLINVSRSEFVLRLQAFAKEKNGYDEDTFQTLRHLCVYVSDQCDGDTPKSRKQDMIKIFKRRMRNKATIYDNMAERQYQLTRELMKEKYWKKIQSLNI